MQALKLKCDECGGSIEVESRFVNSVTCRYCNTVYMLENDKLDPTGQVAEKFEPLSVFETGGIYTYNSKIIKVLGRIRLGDDSDVWDEWYVTVDGVAYWIEESSDLVTMFTSERLKSQIPTFHEITVGGLIKINENSIVVSEKGEAKVIGTEGQFTGRVKPDDKYKFVQGYCDESVYSIEYYPEEIKILKGREMDLSKVEKVSKDS